MPYTVLDKTSAEAAPATTVGDPLTVDNGMSFLELSEELKVRLLNRSDVDETRRFHFLELAYYDLCTSLKLDDLKASIGITVVDGQPMYLLPRVVAAIQEVAILEPESVSRAEGRPLEISDLGAYRARPDDDGLVREWFRHTGMLVVWPTPDYAGATFSVDFRIRPVMPTENYESVWPILAAEWHEGLILLAKHKAMSALEQPEMAQVAQNEYVNFVRRRLDFAQVDLDKKGFGSSVPKTRGQLRRPRRGITVR